MPISNTYLICARGMEGDGSYNDEPGETTFLRVPPGKRSYGEKEQMTKARWKRSVIAAADGDEDEITGARGDILFFVHGYNNDIDTVLWRTRTLQECLTAQGWKGMVVGFDWPSSNSTLNYLEDRSDASAVSQRLIDDALELVVDAQFPDDPNVQPCKINVHLLGHSTGAYVIMEAFAQAAKNGDYYRKPWRIAQVAFIGGDVSCASLAANCDWAAPMYERIFRLTNYSNGYDKVLGVSNMKRMGTAPRAGRVGLPGDAPRKAVNVDCSNYFCAKDPQQSKFTGTFNHSWHIGDDTFALDLALTLEGSIDRSVIPTRELENGKMVLIGGQSRPEYQPQWDENRPPGD
jgi:pimeloyl-ACP methyl ester carboxylesterase